MVSQEYINTPHTKDTNNVNFNDISPLNSVIRFLLLGGTCADAEEIRSS